MVLCHRHEVHEVTGLFAGTSCLVNHHALGIHSNSPSLSSGTQNRQQIDASVIRIYPTSPLECPSRCLLGKRMISIDFQTIKSLTFKDDYPRLVVFKGFNSCGEETRCVMYLFICILATWVVLPFSQELKGWYYHKDDYEFHMQWWKIHFQALGAFPNSPHTPNVVRKPHKSRLHCKWSESSWATNATRVKFLMLWWTVFPM